MIIRSALLVAVLTIVCGLSSARAESLLAVANGEWRGDGWFRKSANGPARATKCLLTMRYLEASRTLSLTGKCAGGGQSAKVSGNLVETTRDRFTGQWHVRGGLKASKMSGARSGNRIELNWSAKVQNSERVENYTANWEISQSRIILSFLAGTGEKDVLLNLDLRR